MKRFLVVQRSYSDFPGGVETQLESRDIGFNYLRPFAGQASPASSSRACMPTGKGFSAPRALPWRRWSRRSISSAGGANCRYFALTPDL